MCAAALQVALGVDGHRVAHELGTRSAAVVRAEALIGHVHLGEAEKVLLRGAARATAGSAWDAAEPVELPLRERLRLVARGVDAPFERRDPVAAELGDALLPRGLLVGPHRA